MSSVNGANGKKKSGWRGVVRELAKAIHDFILPPRICDLPKEERDRARILMWASGVSGIRPDADGKLRVQRISAKEESKDHEENGGKLTSGGDCTD